MTKFLNKNDMIKPSQCDFRINSSTELAITTLYDKLLNNLNENKVTLSLFLDLRKAFDSVNHQLLLKKLCHFGFRGPVFTLLQSYLSDRRICTTLKGKISNLYNVIYGVPQGSLLGPLLFLLYTSMTYHMILNLKLRYLLTILIYISDMIILILFKLKQNMRPLKSITG